MKKRNMQSLQEQAYETDRSAGLLKIKNMQLPTQWFEENTVSSLQTMGHTGLGWG